MERIIVVVPDRSCIVISGDSEQELDKKCKKVKSDLEKIQNKYREVFAQQNAMQLLLLLIPILPFAVFLNFVLVNTFGFHNNLWHFLVFCSAYSLGLKVYYFPRSCDMRVFAEDFWEMESMFTKISLVFLYSASLFDPQVFVFAKFALLDSLWIWLVYRWSKASDRTVRAEHFEEEFIKVTRETEKSATIRSA